MEHTFTTMEALRAAIDQKDGVIQQHGDKVIAIDILGEGAYTASVYAAKADAKTGEQQLIFIEESEEIFTDADKAGAWGLSRV